MDAEYVNIKCEYKDGAFKLSYTGDDNMASYVGLLSGVSIAIEKGATLEGILEFVSNMFYEIKQQNNQDNEITENIVKPKTKEELKQIIKEAIITQGNKANLNFIDTSLISDMSFLFDRSDFNGDISKWDVSNVENMHAMFYGSKFNGDISNWDVSNVKCMQYMFSVSKFNGDISKWDVSNVEDMKYMFYGSKFNGDISKWDVSNVKYMFGMFAFNNFNGDISKWDVSNVKDMSNMFYNSSFNGDISKWDGSTEKDMTNMFYKSPLEKKYGTNGEKLIKKPVKKDKSKDKTCHNCIHKKFTYEGQVNNTFICDIDDKVKKSSFPKNKCKNGVNKIK